MHVGVLVEYDVSDDENFELFEIFDGVAKRVWGKFLGEALAEFFSFCG